MSVKLLTDHHLEFLSLKGGCTGSSESTLVKMPHCWKSHVAAQINNYSFSKLGQRSRPYIFGLFDNVIVITKVDRCFLTDTCQTKNV